MNKEEKLELKSKIEAAIKERIERFNRLWIAETGHSFEEDEMIIKAQNDELDKEYLPKIESRLNELGFSNKKEYFDWLWDTEEKNGIKTRKEHDPVMEELLNASQHDTSIYPYEMNCINQGKLLAEFIIDNCPEDKEIKDYCEQLINEAEDNSYNLIQNLKEAGLTGWDEGHSGNSAGASVSFCFVLIEHPDWFQYMHGALTPLVGDEGYHDHRDDLPEYLTKKGGE